MRRFIMTAALLALPGAMAAAQAHQHDASHDAMKPGCPMHMTGLDLSAAQDSAIAAIRAAHMGDMMPGHTMMGAGHAGMAGHQSMAAGHATASAQAHGAMKMSAGMHAGHAMADSAKPAHVMTAEAKAAMQAKSALVRAAIREVLDDSQRSRFDAAITKHEAAKAASAAAGEKSACCECCDDCSCCDCVVCCSMHGEHAAKGTGGTIPPR